MKRLLAISVFFLSFHFGNSQDIIVTTEGDTIECEITRISEEFIHFSVFDKGGGILMRSRLPLDGVQYYQQSEDTDEIPDKENTEMEMEESFLSESYDPPTFRFALSSGYTYQFAGYENLPNSYKNQLQSLWNIGGDLQYFPSENFGFGLKYIRLSTNANEDFEPPYSNAFGFSKLRDEKVRFNYFGISFILRNSLSLDQFIHYYISGGLLNYRSDLEGDGTPYYQEGDTFGFVFEVSYDFNLVENFGVGIGAKVTIANMYEFDNNGTQVNADFELSRVDVSIGLLLFK